MTTEKLRPGSPEEAGMRPERVAYAREWCARFVKDGNTPTLGVCVARHGVIVLHEAFGILGPGPDSAALERDALFPIMSVTKPITATLVLQLVEDGLLGLNRPAKDYLPEISGDGTDEILVHHLLTHTSGYMWHVAPPMLQHIARKLQAGSELPPCPRDLHPTVHQALALLWDAPRLAAAGEVMTYSNHNYQLLGEIVRRLSGRSIEAQARERLFGPLGMSDTYYVVPKSEAPRVVQRAPGLPFGATDAPFMPPCIGSREWQETPHAGGGAFSTPLDLVVFGQMFLNRGRYAGARVLSPAAVAAMTRDQIPGTKARFFDKVVEHASWGYGWAIDSPTKWPYFQGGLAPLGTLCHPGAGGAMCWVDPANDLVGAYFEVTTRLTERMEHLWGFDLFQNVITSAVES
jgi:CubicO group peptidase (beta-lactamase class C family)